MGNSLTQKPLWLSTNFDLELSDEALIHVNTTEDARLGQIDLFQYKTTEIVLVRKEISLENDAQLTDDNLRKLKARVHLRNDSLLRIYGFKLDLPKNEPNKIGIFFESFASDSLTEFLAHQKDQLHFSEEELYESTLTVLRVLAYLQKHHVSHGHLTPDSILMSSEGDIKLLDHSLFERENSAYYACLQGSKIPYISPELVALLDKNTPIPEGFDPFKADVFSLGMTFLFGALLEEPFDCYDWDKHSFDESRLAERLTRVRGKYPGRLPKLLSHMLKTNPAERPDSIDLLTNLQEYEKDDLKFSESKQSVVKSNIAERRASERDYGYTKSTQHYLANERVGPSDKYQENHRAVNYYTPQKESTYYNSGSYLSFVDPKVVEVIKEIKEKSSNKSTASPAYRSDFIASPEKSGVTSSGLIASSYNEKYHSPEKATIWSEKYTPASERELRYRNPFIENYESYLSHRLIHNELPRDLVKTEGHAYKTSFNTPEVNELIANLRNIHTTTSTSQIGLKTSPIKQNEYIGTHTIKKPVDVEMSISLSSTYRLPERIQSFESPQKKDYNQLVRETDRYFWGSGIKTSNPDIPIDTGKYQKKIQTKEEIIKELRGKYGAKSAQKNAETEEKIVSQEQTTQPNQKETAPKKETNVDA